MALLAALAFLLAAAGLHCLGKPVELTVPVWFSLAVTTEFVLGRSWALVLALIPWPLGVGLGLATGRYPLRGDGWKTSYPLAER